MNLFGWWRRRHQQTSPKGVRLARLLTEGEARTWRTLEATTPPGRRCLPMVPLGLLVEGALPEELAGEVIPFVEVTADGFLTAAFFHQRTPALELLEGLGVSCRLLKELETAFAPGNEAAASPAAAPPAPPHPEGKDNPSPPPENQEQEELEELEEGKVESAARDLAQLWWRGEIHEIVRLPKAEEAKEVAEEGRKAEEERPAEKRPAGRAKEEGRGEEPPRCPVCGAEMVLKVARKGKMAGQEFWSCSRYPECKGTRPKKSAKPSGEKPA